MQRTRSHWSHREPKQISKWLLRMMTALIGLCLLQLLTGCGNSRTVYVPVSVVPLPANLTAETPQPDLPDPFTWGASLNLNVALLSALAQCNRDKADIRTFEKNRAAQTNGTIKR
ncbi:Rz1-like lysis system protein LysC [Escherichia coli]